MPHKRLIATLIVKDGWIVQSIGFERFQPLGRPEIAARFLDCWGIDEIVVLDIDASRERRLIDPKMIERISANCFVPVTAGGGIGAVADVRTLLSAGADKVCINRTALTDPVMLGDAATHFGQQCIMVSIDARPIGPATYRVYGDNGSRRYELSPAVHAQSAAHAGAGEILLTAVNRDGAKSGYDLILAHQVADAVTVPVIIAGGAGRWEHIAQVLAIDAVSAAAAANFLHFTEHSVAIAKAMLKNQGIDVRLDAITDYADASTRRVNGRLDKEPDSKLLEQVFDYVPEETI